MPSTSNPLWPAFLTVILTVAILLSAVVATMVMGRRRLARAESRFTSELVRAQDVERERVSAEVHDDFGNNLTLVANNLTRLQQLLTPLEVDPAPLRGAIAEVNHVAEGIRNLAHRLHPTRVDKAGLMVALRELVDLLSVETELTIHLQGLEEPLPRAPAGWALYRIVQEATRNAATHGQATEVHVTLRRLEGALELEVQDDGQGFDVEHAQTATDGGIGLRLMRERAAVVGGTLHVTSRVGSGTTIRCQVPFDPEQADA